MVCFMRQTRPVHNYASRPGFGRAGSGRPDDCTVVLPDGTEFTVVTTEEITSKTASEGDLLTFKVAVDVVINGHVVIAKDALVKGEVSTAKTGTTVALVVLFGPLGFLKKGKQAIIKPGTAIKVYTDEAKSVQVKTGAVAVLPKSLIVL